MMLCCLHNGFNGTVGLSLSQVFLESISEDGVLCVSHAVDVNLNGVVSWYENRLGSMSD